jgi:hypothetical protein
MWAVVTTADQIIAMRSMQGAVDAACDRRGRTPGGHAFARLPRADAD